MTKKPKSGDVTQRPDGKWQYKGDGNSRASTVTDTQAEADKRGAGILANQGGGELRVHGKDGRIRDKRTIAPGNDPYPPKG